MCSVRNHGIVGVWRGEPLVYPTPHVILAGDIVELFVAQEYLCPHPGTGLTAHESQRAKGACVRGDGARARRRKGVGESTGRLQRVHHAIGVHVPREADRQRKGDHKLWRGAHDCAQSQQLQARQALRGAGHER